MTGEKPFVEGIEVIVEVSDATLPPKLTFSFPGLDDPVELWAELEQLGWIVPDRPEHPAPEIDWNSPGGSKYHILPYRVEGLEVVNDNWPANTVAERGLKTINLLRKYGIELEVPVAYLAFLRRTQLSTRNDQKKKAVERATKVPRTLLLSKQPYSVIADDREIALYETAAGPNQPHWYWAESERSVYELGDSDESRSELLNSVALGWELVSRMDAPPTIDGKERTLRFLVRDPRDGTGMLDLLKDNVGEKCASLLMRPIERTGAFENCLLMIAVVPVDRFAEIGQTLINSFPDAIGRGRRYKPLSSEEAA